MSKAAIERLSSELGDRILETSDFRGDDEAVVAPGSWLEVATFLKQDPELAMNHFIDLTAVDYPEREPDEPRFDVLLFVRSVEKKHRVRIKTRVEDGQKLASLCSVWAGANWAEREVFDLFGIEFEAHPDLRRILMYPEFVGHPLRKDYPIDRAQPLVPYREVEDITKLPPFGVEEGQPWGRIDWQARLEGREMHTSPAIAYQTKERRMLSDSDAYNYLLEKIDRQAGSGPLAAPRPLSEQEPEETGNESKE